MMNDLTIEELKKIRDDALDAVAAADAANAAAWDAYDAYDVADAAYEAALNKKKEGCNMTGDYYYEQLVACLEKRNRRITELEAQVEALTPKPTVKREWLAVYPNWSGWYGKRSDALDTQITGCDFIALVRKDVITHPDGKVEYKLEVENA